MSCLLGDIFMRVWIRTLSDMSVYPIQTFIVQLKHAIHVVQPTEVLIESIYQEYDDQCKRVTFLQNRNLFIEVLGCLYKKKINKNLNVINRTGALVRRSCFYSAGDSYPNKSHDLSGPIIGAVPRNRRGSTCKSKTFIEQNFVTLTMRCFDFPKI